MLPDDNLYALEPAKHEGVVFRKIERLRLTIWEHAIAHVWTIRLVHPSVLWPYERRSVNAGRGMSVFVSAEVLVAGAVEETQMHLSPSFVLIWHLVLIFDDWAHCQIRKGPRPSLW
jgi:hypothetical protein